MYILPIVGIIGEPDKGEEHLQHFRFTDLLMHLNAAKDSNHIHLLIDSDGGDVDEGEKMKKALLASKKTFTSSNSGNVASMAVDLFLIPNDKASRKFDPEKGIFLIHNPWANIEGDSEYMAEASKQLKSIETKFVKEYAQKTGADPAVLTGFMNENKPLTTEQISELGFATIQNREFKAVAKFNLNTDKMEIQELEKKMTGFEKILNKINEKLFKPKALMLQDVNGAEIDFGAEIETPEQIQVGVMATVDGSPAEGEYAIEDGTVYVFVSGELTEIRIPEGEMEALKKENEDLKAELESLKAENTEQVQSLNKELEGFKAKAKEAEELKDEFEKFKSEFSDFKVKANLPAEGKKNEKKKFTYKK